MDELCCLHLTGENNGKKDHTVSCMVDQLVREGHCYCFEQFVPSSLSPPFHLCMGTDSWSLYKPNALAFSKVPRILCKAFVPRRVKKKQGSWIGTKIFLSFPGGLPNGKHIHISTIASPATCWSHCLQNSSWLGVPRPSLTHGGRHTLWGHQWKGMFPFHTVFIFQSMRMTSWRTGQLCDLLQISHLSTVPNTSS